MESQQDAALLVMDMQFGILSTFPQADKIIGNIAQAIAAARKNNIPVIYVRLGLRPGAPEISLNNKTFTAAKQRFANIDMEQFMTVHPSLAPLPNDILITKKRFSAFAGSDLEIVLRSNGIQHLVLTGVVTSGVVLSTYVEATDMDFKQTVLSDGCADRDEEVHRVLIEKVFPRQADVLTATEWISQLQNH